MARQTLLYAFDEGMTHGDYAFLMLQLNQQQYVRNIKNPGQIFVLLNLPPERWCDYNQAMESVILVEIKSTVVQETYEAFEEKVKKQFDRFSPSSDAPVSLRFYYFCYRTFLRNLLPSNHKLCILS